ncbi:hypothetical protein [Methanosarcina sp. UBA5]|nr:hypothetical protein [Methanosarcina sp. UBA5]
MKNQHDNNISVIDTSTNSVIATMHVREKPVGIAKEAMKRVM